MRILLINQAFSPDVVATAQYLADVARALAARGDEVTVLASRRAYDAPSVRFPREETLDGVRVVRVAGTGLGKGAKWRRIADFASFFLSASIRALLLPRQDMVVALTSPPLIAAAAATVARLKRAKFAYWVMDLNPEEALAAGWLGPGVAARALAAVSRYTVSSASAVIVLDRFMRERVAAKGGCPDAISIVPPWSHDRYVRFDPAGRREFRREHGLEGRYVVMYSGNHSPCHPLTTLLEAARLLREDERFCFVFAGGGSELARVKDFAAAHELRHVRVLPYQPLTRLAASMSAADMQAVVMGDPFVGLIHPSKVYNILAVGAPVLYIGPERSHVSEIFEPPGMNGRFYRAAHGDAGRVAEHLRAAIAPWKEDAARVGGGAEGRYAQAKRIPEFLGALDWALARPAPAAHGRV